MATFTIELRTILARGIDIGLQDYPIFEEDYRAVLNRKITGYYKYREIGFETVDQFIDRLNQRMDLIMPGMNKFYRSALIEFDPLITQRVISESKSIITGYDISNTNSSASSESSGTGGSKSRAVNSDFPQTMLSSDGDYATGATDSIGESTNTAISQDTGDQSSEHDSTRQSDDNSSVEGMIGSPSRLLSEFRDTIINVDLMVISELDSLFMGLWDIGDELGSY